MLRPVVVLPQPLSPTRPSTSPARTVNDTPSTAFTYPVTRENSPLRMGNHVRRSVTSSNVSGSPAVVDAVA